VAVSTPVLVSLTSLPIQNMTLYVDFVKVDSLTLNVTTVRSSLLSFSPQQFGAKSVAANLTPYPSRTFCTSGF
jgi:hypothetical protein